MQQIPKSATRRTARATATERFHATAGRSNGVKALVGAIAVAFLVVMGFVFLSPRNDPAIEQYHIETAIRQAHQAEDAGQFDAAVAKFEEALRLMGASETWRTHAIEVRGWIKDVKRRREERASAEAEWKALRDEARACPPEKVHACYVKAAGTLKLHEKMPWAPELRQLVADLESRLKQGPPDPIKRRAQIVEGRKLDGPKGTADWSGAIRDWKDYLALQISDEWRTSAKAEMARLHLPAREELDSIGKRAARMAEDGNKAEALALLKSQRARFELTESAPALEKLIARHDR